MRNILFLLVLLFATNSFAVSWVEQLGLKERASAPTAQTSLGQVWVEQASKDLMFRDSLGVDYNILLGGGIGGAQLNDMSDVDTFTASPTVGQALTYNGSLWVPATPASSLSLLTDVALATPTEAQVLTYNGTTSKWENKNPTGKTLVGTSPVVITQDATSATFSLGVADYIDFATGVTPSSVQGRVSFDSTEKTLKVDVDPSSGVYLQVGQEQFIRAVNKTGASINDGDVVYISGAQGNRPTIAKATGTLPTGPFTVAVATQGIADNAEGMVTTSGVVGSYNTSSFSDGARLYLSQSTAGSLTATRPTTGLIVPVAWALNTTTVGKILVDIGAVLDATTTLANNSDLFAPTQKAVKAYIDGAAPSITGTANYVSKFTGSGLTASSIFDNGTNVGIGTITPASKFSVIAPALGGVIGNQVKLAEFSNATSNMSKLNISTIRTANGTTWETSGLKLQQIVDSSPMGYVQFGGDGNQAGVTIGAGFAGSETDSSIEAIRIIGGGNVGIGKIPTTKLDVNGTLLATRITQSAAATSNSLLAITGLLTPNDYGQSQLVHVQANVTPVADQSAFYGMIFLPTFRNSSNNVTYLNGIFSRTDLNADFSGTIANLSNFVSDPPDIRGTGTVTNLKGFVSNIPAGANKFNFYTGADAVNFFMGNTGIGIAAPETKLHVSGDSTVTGYQYFGSPSVNGSYRMFVSGTALVTQKRVSGTWTEVARLDND